MQLSAGTGDAHPAATFAKTVGAVGAHARGRPASIVRNMESADEWVQVNLSVSMRRSRRLAMPRGDGAGTTALSRTTGLSSSPGATRLDSLRGAEMTDAIQPAQPQTVTPPSRRCLRTLSTCMARSPR